jgi:N6-L-threonylcarbamoyladenine synthase
LIASQTDVHAKWGGVIPEIAAREHLVALDILYQQLIAQSGVKTEDIDVIGVTQGPGLIGCLLVGAAFAKGLSQSLHRPLVPVNHVHAHVAGALLGLTGDLGKVFPTLALVVSGGHTNLYYMTHPTHFELLAHTMDDACGESFDKVGKMLGLPYPGGPHVESLARQGVPGKVEMPRMVERKRQLAFSYSGLKTAVSHSISRSGDQRTLDADIAFAFQEEALGQIVRKLNSALMIRRDVRSIIVAGGVAANSRFREMMNTTFAIPCWFPPLKYCSDNGAMIAAMAYYEQNKNQHLHGLDWDVFSRYPFEQFASKELTG